MTPYHKGNVMRNFRIQVSCWPSSATGDRRNSPFGPDVEGTVHVPMIASDNDNEENAVRAAEQMVRDAFRRWREKKHVVVRMENGVYVVMAAKCDGEYAGGLRVVLLGTSDECIAEAVRLNEASRNA